MLVRVLGSAAGGGFPQWNCNCDNCKGIRTKSIQALPRTQSSIAVSSDESNWVLFNASPDIRQQILAFPQLNSIQGIRGTGIKAIVLMDSHIDHVTGLLLLREGQPLQIYCTHSVYNDLTETLPIINVLSHFCGVEHHVITVEPQRAFSIDGIANLEFLPLSLAGKAPPYSSHRQNPHPDDNIAMVVRDKLTGAFLFYAPGLAQIDSSLHRVMRETDCVLVDGTCWTNDELIRQGISHKTATDMGHLPQAGEAGMVNLLKQMSKPRKVLIHINNTNPILNELSQERAMLTETGIEVAYDGMEIRL